MKTQRDDSNNATLFYRTPYNYDKNLASKETAFAFHLPTKTQQNTQDETDINIIVQKFASTGMLPQARTLPTYGDFTAVSDYQSALNLIIEAQNAFLDLPAQIRAKFNHDPGQFVAFIDSEPDGQLLLDLGLGHLVSPKTETPPAPPTPAPAGTPATGISQPVNGT